MAAFLSKTVDLVACQFGSAVSLTFELDEPLDGIEKEFEWLKGPGDASGEDGALTGCVICMLFVCCCGCCCCWPLDPAAGLCGGDNKTPPLFKVSTGKEDVWKISLKNMSVTLASTVELNVW